MPAQKAALAKALTYMDLRPVNHCSVSRSISLHRHCTNSRISDLRLAASVLKDRKVAPNLRVMIRARFAAREETAEAEGLDRIFKAAGANGAKRAARCASR